MNLSVVGLGKRGTPLAACLAAKGHYVIGADLREQVVLRINEGRPPVFEPGLEELMSQAEGRLSAIRNLGEAVVGSDVTFVLVPAPGQTTGAISLKHVLSAAKEIGRALRRKDTYHLVVLASTVMPGDTGGKLLPTLEKYSGKRCGPDFGLCYNPEFMALGSVIRDLLNPNVILIGESDARAGDRLAELYRTLCDSQPAIVRMAFVNAEIAKLAVNTFLTTKISFVNLLAEVCERFEGGDVDAVTTALGRDSRIGAKCLQGALGYGGPSLPRDNAALAYLSRRLGVSMALPRAADSINSWQVIRLKKLVQAHLPGGGAVGVLGLAYKPHTNVVERAQGFELAQSLLDNGIPVAVYDPAPIDATRWPLKGRVRYAASALECARQVDVLVIGTPCEEFKSIQRQLLKRNRRKLTVIDCWRLIDPEQLAVDVRYLAIGQFDRAKSRSHSARKRLDAYSV